MATNPIPTPSSKPAGTPPSFYAQAAMAKPATPAPKPHAEETEKFRAAIPKLLVIFDKLEKLKPNGKDISKGVKAMADTLKEIRINVFSDEDETSPEAASAASTEAPAPAPPVVPGSTEAV